MLCTDDESIYWTIMNDWREMWKMTLHQGSISSVSDREEKLGCICQAPNMGECSTGKTPDSLSPYLALRATLSQVFPKFISTCQVQLKIQRTNYLSSVNSLKLNCLILRGAITLRGEISCWKLEVLIIAVFVGTKNYLHLQSGKFGLVIHIKQPH